MFSSGANLYKPEPKTATVMRKLKLGIWGTSWSLNVLHATAGAHGELVHTRVQRQSWIKLPLKAALGDHCLHLWQILPCGNQRFVTLLCLFVCFSLTVQFLFHSCRKISVPYSIFSKPWEDQPPKRLRPHLPLQLPQFSPWIPKQLLQCTCSGRHWGCLPA